MRIGRSYKQRVEPLTKDPTAFEAARLQFESFVARLEDALAAAMPEARVEQMRAEARLVKPTPRVPAERPVTGSGPARVRSRTWRITPARWG